MEIDMNVKSKLIVAYEKESSVTLRVTPFDLGVAFSRIPIDQLELFMKGVKSTDFFCNDLYKAKRNAIIDKLKDFGE